MSYAIDYRLGHRLLARRGLQRRLVIDRLGQAQQGAGLFGRLGLEHERRRRRLAVRGRQKGIQPLRLFEVQRPQAEIGRRIQVEIGPALGTRIVGGVGDGLQPRRDRQRPRVHAALDGDLRREREPGARGGPCLGVRRGRPHWRRPGAGPQQ